MKKIILAAQSFPTPMEEPKKILRAQYLGCSEVQQAVGMNTINDAIIKISGEAAPESWMSVNVSISPSMIAVRPSGVSWAHETRAGYC
jgi:amyloid beta A4 precursor protein-binding family B member 2